MAAHHPAEVAFRVLDGDELTFAQWEATSNRAGRGLSATGVRPGDRVAIYVTADDALPWVVTYAAIHKAGAVAVPLNTRLTRPELEALLNHAEATAMVCSPSLTSIGAQLSTAVPSLDVTISTAAASDGARAWDEVLAGDDSAFQVPVEPG